MIQMRYISTRNTGINYSASQAIAKGLAEDGGLLTPYYVPKLPGTALEDLKHMSYQQRAVYVMSQFLDEFSIKELTSDNSLNCELMLIKLKNDPEARDEIHSAAEAFKAETIDYSREAIVLRLIGSGRKMDEFISLMRDYTILEICRTGTASLEKGGAILRQNLNL